MSQDVRRVADNLKRVVDELVNTVNEYFNTSDPDKKLDLYLKLSKLYNEAIRLLTDLTTVEL